MAETSCPPPKSGRGSSVLLGGRRSCIPAAAEVAGRQSGCTPPCQRIASPSSSPHWQQSPELWQTSAGMTDRCRRGCCWWSSPPRCDPASSRGNCRAPWSSGEETWPNLHTWARRMRRRGITYMSYIWLRQLSIWYLRAPATFFFDFLLNFIY